MALEWVKLGPKDFSHFFEMVFSLIFENLRIVALIAFSLEFKKNKNLVLKKGYLALLILFIRNVFNLFKVNRKLLLKVLCAFLVIFI